MNSKPIVIVAHLIVYANKLENWVYMVFTNSEGNNTGIGIFPKCFLFLVMIQSTFALIAHMIRMASS